MKYVANDAVDAADSYIFIIVTADYTAHFYSFTVSLLTDHAHFLNFKIFTFISRSASSLITSTSSFSQSSVPFCSIVPVDFVIFWEFPTL